MYSSRAYSSHGGGWIRPSKILLRYNTYVKQMIISIIITKNLTILRFIQNCMIHQQLKVNIEHLLYPSQANLSHGGSWIRPSKILLRYNTYVRTNNYIDQIYSNAHIVPWSCRFWFQSLFKYTSYGSKLYHDDISQFGTFYSISIAITSIVRASG